jgi:hypothetical protein
MEEQKPLSLVREINIEDIQPLPGLGQTLGE